ncbi:hypothetical protein ACFXBB_12165 [Streptomyces scopuliridis]|uniref:hypothetical protein n=1 Tax=Streptomyces scopuliridis TaxID=452529 RepID=UPI0036D073FD
MWAPEDASPTGYRRITRGDAGAAWRELVDADGAEDGPGVATSSGTVWPGGRGAVRPVSA